MSLKMHSLAYALLQVGDPVILVFDNGASGFLSLPRPLFGSECDDNNPAGTCICIL